MRRLRSFVSERGKIIPRRISGSCARHQRALTHAIKRARTIALLPYLAATLVNAVSNAILASVFLEVLGLGPIDAPTLGMTLYWVNFNAALINGWWWWWAAPVGVIVILFMALFLIAGGLDEVANPRLRRVST